MGQTAVNQPSHDQDNIEPQWFAGEQQNYYCFPTSHWGKQRERQWPQTSKSQVTSKSHLGFGRFTALLNHSYGAVSDWSKSQDV